MGFLLPYKSQAIISHWCFLPRILLAGGVCRMQVLGFIPLWYVRNVEGLEPMIVSFLFIRIGGRFLEQHKYEQKEKVEKICVNSDYFSFKWSFSLCSSISLALPLLWINGNIASTHTPNVCVCVCFLQDLQKKDFQSYFSFRLCTFLHSRNKGRIYSF